MTNDVVLITTIVAQPVIHESGHWLAARLFGLKARFSFSSRYKIPYPLVQVWEPDNLEKHKKIAIAFAGIEANLIFAEVCWLLGFHEMTFCCLGIVAFALIPVRGSDLDAVRRTVASRT